MMTTDVKAVTKQMKRFLGVATLALTAQFSVAEEVKLDRIVAIVGDDVVMETELNSRLESIYKRIQQSGTQAPPRDQVIPQVLEQLVLERLQLGIGERNGLRISDAEINQSLQRLAAAQSMNFDQFVEKIHEDGLNLADLRRQIRDEIIIRRIQEGIVKDNIRISLQEITNFMDSEEGQFWKSPELLLGHIKLQLSAGAPKERVATVTENANKLVQELREGADFKQYAITKSAGQNALKGGDLGWRRSVQLPPVLSVAVVDLQPGDISDPVRSDSGLHIFTLYDRRGGEQEVVVKQYNVRHVLLKTNEIRDDEAAYNQLMDIRSRALLKENEDDFSTLAREFSQDIGSALGGGNLGWSVPGKFVPEFEQMMESIEVGEISYPFRSQFGWHILEVTEVRDQDFSGEVMSNRAAEILRERKFEEELEIWLQEQRSDAYVEFKI